MTRDGQTEHIEQYENWTGAQYIEMQPDGSLQPVKLSAEDRQRRVRQLGQAYVDDIRHALQMRTDEIQCSCADKEVLDWVKSQFTDAEWRRVKFTFWGVPQPTVTKQL